MICKIKHFHKANKTTKAKNLNKKSFQRKKSANKYENLIKNVTKQAEARRAKTKSVNVHCAVVATDSDSQFAFNQSLCIAAIDLDPCAHSPMINKILDRNHFNVILNPSLCVLGLSLLWPATRSISLCMDILTWNFNLAAVGKQIFFSSIWQKGIKCDYFRSELKPVLKKQPAYAE